MQNTLRAHWHTYISAWTYTGSSYQSGIFTFPSGFCKQSWTIQIYLNRRFFVMALGGKTFMKTRGKSKSKKDSEFSRNSLFICIFWDFWGFHQNLKVFQPDVTWVMVSGKGWMDWNQGDGQRFTWLIRGKQGLWSSPVKWWWMINPPMMTCLIYGWCCEDQGRVLREAHCKGLPWLEKRTFPIFGFSDVVCNYRYNGSVDTIAAWIQPYAFQVRSVKSASTSDKLKQISTPRFVYAARIDTKRMCANHLV